MEIVPILSTIILVGTVATFILAVAAYILYKMREGGAQESDVQMEQEMHHVVMAQNMAQTHMHAPPMYASNPAPKQAAMFNAPPHPSQQHYINANSAAGLPPQQPVENSDFLLQGNQTEGQPINSFFWDYSDEGFAPITVNGNSKEAQNGALKADPLGPTPDPDENE